MNMLQQFAAGIGPQCARQGCGNLAVYQPVIQLRAYPDCEPAEMQFGLGVCPACRDQHGRVEDVLSDQAYDVAVQMLRNAGKADPVRSLTTVRWAELPASHQ